MPERVTAVIRSKNEGRLLEYCIRDIALFVDEVVAVDNQSIDQSFDSLRRSLDHEPCDAEIRLSSYDHEIARVGSEHARTHPSRPESLVSFYNYSFNLAGSPWVLKWDADMFLTQRGANLLASLRSGITAFKTVSFGRIATYFVHGLALTDDSRQTFERHLYLNDPPVPYRKAVLFEALGQTANPRLRVASAALELKNVNCWHEEIEGTWSSLDDARALGRSRKVREFEVFTALSDCPVGKIEAVADDLGLTVHAPRSGSLPESVWNAIAMLDR